MSGVLRSLAALLAPLPLLATSCGTAPPMPDPPATHPASPSAAEAPRPPASRAFEIAEEEPREKRSGAMSSGGGHRR
ncbi:MAG: hypothetical protein JNM84_28305 [Planctomycetes bacterium]|nr:hypothetical protein [Planctomycetota bacterium]